MAAQKRGEYVWEPTVHIGDKNATQLTAAITWAGSYTQCARTMDVSLAVSELDGILPSIPCELGAPATLRLDGLPAFSGYIFSRQRDSGSNTIEAGCCDRGIYLKRNQACYQFNGMTPEAIAQRICADFGIPVGVLAQTGVPVRRIFSGASLYQMIQTAYTLASVSTGERYLIRFEGEALNVVVKKQSAETLVLRPGSNLITLTATDSIENMVNQVAIYNKNGSLAAVRTDEAAVALYGLMQGYLRQADGRDSESEARKILEDGGVSQKITATCMGNPKLISGNCVALQEPVTGLYGLCWIDSDTHTWKNGLYQTRLTLNFRNLMDEQEVGQLPNA